MEEWEKSLAHFDSMGMNFIAASCYEIDDLNNVENWLDAMDKYNATGIIYTTWLETLDLLDEFGQLLIKRGRAPE